MDNGHASQMSGTNGIFTPNLDGTQINQSPSMDSVPIDQAAWAPSRDNKDIGNKVISSNEAPSIDNPIEQANTAGGLGQVVDLESPITQSAPPTQENGIEAVSVAITFDENMIRNDGDRISKDALREAKKVEDQLDQTGDVNSLYDEIGKMRNAYRKNSFNEEPES